jgi:hypothetical protein
MGSCLKVRVVVVRDSIFDSPNHFVDSGATSARVSDKSMADQKMVSIQGSMLLYRGTLEGSIPTPIKRYCSYLFDRFLKYSSSAQSSHNQISHPSLDANHNNKCSSR